MDEHNFLDVLVVALQTHNARRTARRAVRNGMTPQQASWHATQSMMLFNALGVIVFLWIGVGLTVWIRADGVTDPDALRLFHMWELYDSIVVGWIVLGSFLWTRINPYRTSGLLWLLTRSWILLPLMAAWFPVHWLLPGWLGMKY